MTYHLKLLEAGQWDYDQLKRRSSADYDVWFNPFFMVGIASLHGLKPLLLHVYKGGELVALLPLYERKKLSIKALVCPVGAYYQGLHFFLDDKASPGRTLLDICAISSEVAIFLAARYPRINLKLHPENSDVRGFTWNGFRAQPLYTFEHSTGEPLSIIRDEKAKLAKAEKAGMQLKECFDIESFLRLQHILEGRKGHNLGIAAKRMEIFLESMHKLGLLKQFNVMYDGRVVSSNIVYYDGGARAFAVFMASDPAAMKMGASTLHNVAMLSCLPETCLSLDYCGANVPEVARFKAALGLKLRVFYSLGKLRGI